MDDSKELKEGLPQPLQGPHWPGIAGAPEGFVPMKIILLPSGMTVELTRTDTLVGRHMSADLRLPLPDVSRQHCRFIFGEYGWKVVDQGSLNGIYVNAQRVQQAVLHHGDHVRIGSFTFQIDLQSNSSTIVSPTSESDRVIKSIVEVLDSRPDPKRQAS